ncbi:unnamed protein product (mitochondrion) [Plasmodiophora brassicae]|uniref:Galactosyltransferase C-terminal domain-containing protein n=2 Tax=Plasmodiophora brassicae TaxID=37360 RepID=A0A3P3YDM1_PLABS|nr:unnamed protein product [Plasmodiophora brassicae]
MLGRSSRWRTQRRQWRRRMQIVLAAGSTIWVLGVITFMRGLWTSQPETVRHVFAATAVPDNAVSYCNGATGPSKLFCVPDGRSNSGRALYCVGTDAMITATRGLSLQCSQPSQAVDSILDIPLTFQSSSSCESSQSVPTVVIQAPSTSSLEVHLAFIERIAKILRRLGIDNARVLYVGAALHHEAVWVAAFSKVLPAPTSTSLCLSTLVYVVDTADDGSPPDYQFQRSLVVTPAPARKDPFVRTVRAAMVFNCKSKQACPMAHELLPQFKDSNLDVTPLYSTSSIRPNVIGALDVLIVAANGPLDAIVALLPPSAMIIGLQQEAGRPPSRLRQFQPNLAYRRVPTTGSVFNQLYPVIGARLETIPGVFPEPELPSEVRQARWRSASPGNPRLAVIVPFRDSASNTSQGAGRTANLREFAAYMNRFLTRAGRDFEIIVVEQEEGVLFNKGALFNIGYHLAKRGFAYIALHDVDQIPVDDRNTYEMPSTPLHLCSASSQYGWQPAYPTMVGGALLVTVADYKRMNGMSNRYWGWGMEDDDLYQRIMGEFKQAPKLDPSIGRYKALDHPRVKDLDVTPLFNYNREYLGQVENGLASRYVDGVNTIRYRVNNVVRDPLGFTKYNVGLALPWMPKSLDEIPRRP